MKGAKSDWGVKESTGGSASGGNRAGLATAAASEGAPGGSAGLARAFASTGSACEALLRRDQREKNVSPVMIGSFLGAAPLYLRRSAAYGAVWARANSCPRPTVPSTRRVPARRRPLRPPPRHPSSARARYTKVSPGRGGRPHPARG